MTDYITLAEILAIHDDQIMRYGGVAGLRDQNLLDSALFRPQSGYYTDVIAEAAALWESLLQNHPFIDGNKRTAFAAMFTFLHINGWRITANAEETYLFIIDMFETQTLSFDNLEQWLRQNTKAINE